MKLSNAQKGILTIAALGAAMFATAGVVSKVQSAPQHLSNGGFEEGSVGKAAKGWYVPPALKQHGYEVKLSDKAPHSGKQCLMIYGSPTSDVFGNAMQAFAAGPVRGKHFRYSAYLKTDGLGESRAQLWVRVDRKGEQEGFFDNMYDRPAISNSWTMCTIEGTVDADAEAFNFGAILVGKGRVYVDDAKLEFFD